MSAEDARSQVLEHNQPALRQLLASIRAHKYCVLLGPRFAGKTALFHVLMAEFAGDPSYICVVINLDDADTRTQASFFTYLAQHILGSVAARAGSVPSDLPLMTTGPIFRDFLQDLLSRLDHDIVLILDHIEDVPRDLLRRLLSALRALNMEGEDDWQPGGAQLVVVLGSALNLATVAVGKTSPFYNIATTIAIGDLTEQQSAALIEAAVSELEVEPSAASLLLRTTAGDAHLIRMICRCVVQAALSDSAPCITTSHVEQVVQQFVQAQAMDYQPLSEGVRLIEEDPELLICVLQLLKHSLVPRRELPLPLSQDNFDPLYLTGLIRRVPNESYQLRNEIYRLVLLRRFSPSRVGHLLAMAGRWEAAIDHMSAHLVADNVLQMDLLEVSINAMHAADDPRRAARYLKHILKVVFGIKQASIRLLAPDGQTLIRVDQPDQPAEAEDGLAGYDISLRDKCLEVQVFYETYPQQLQEGDALKWVVPLCIPGRKPIGVMTIELPTEDQTYIDQAERELQLTGYINQATRAFQEINSRRQQADTLHELSNVLGRTLRLPEVLELILDQMRRLVPFDTASIQLLSSDYTELKIIASKGFRDPAMLEGVGFSLKENYPNVLVWRTKQPRRYGKVWADFPHFRDSQYQVAEVHSWLGVPLLVSGEAKGVITLDSYTPDLYTLEHENLAMTIASQAAMAIQRAQLFDREQQEKGLLQAAAQMIGAVHDLDQTWRLILDGVMRLTKAEHGNISLVDTANKMISNVIEEGFPTESGREYPIESRGVLSWVATHKRSALIRDVKNESPWKEIYREGRGDTAAELAVPILNSNTGAIFGIINLESPREAAFNQADQRLLEALAVHAELAVNNAAQYKALKDRQQRLEALYVAGQTIVQAGLQIKDVLQAILDQCVRVTHGSFGSLQLVEGDDLVFVAAYPQELLPELQEKLGKMPIHGRGIAPRAVRERYAQLVVDVRQDPAFVDVTGESGSELAVVLLDNARPIGVLNVEHRERNGLDEDDRQLLIALANLAVVAVQNAEQYKQLEQTYKELENAKNYLLASEAVAWLGLFGADWQHTINQKIFSIMIYVDGLERWLDAHEVPAEVARRVQHALGRITNVIENIRKVRFTSQVPAEMPREENGATIIDKELVEIIERWCSNRSDITVQPDLNAPGVAVKILPQWLHISMEKLINNALKAMPEGGTLTLKTKVVNDMVQITIKDMGRGIPPSARPYFLKRVVPRARGESGTGMGSLIARFIALSHDGDLVLVDSSDAGTELLLMLPIATEQGTASARMRGAG